MYYYAFYFENNVSFWQQVSYIKHPHDCEHIFDSFEELILHYKSNICFPYNQTGRSQLPKDKFVIIKKIWDQYKDLL